MKQYLLLLKSSDFNKSNNIWESNAVNVYANSQYKNYSHTRSAYGLDLIGDRTYTGYELTSPSFHGNHSTPITDQAIYVTDAGEVEYDVATPSLIRFIDTSSRIDILSYRHIFTNVSGQANPSFNIQILESDEEDGPWLNSPMSGESGTILLKNCKQFIKVELEINSDGLDINSLGLVFYLEIGIHEITSPIISDNTRNILRRFPTWTALYSDSEDYATPSLATPESVGGKFLTALTQNTLDKIQVEIDLFGINSYITTANENMLAWAHITYGVPPNINSIKGDNVSLASVSTLSELFDLKPTDYAYHYNPIDRQIITTRAFSSLTVNGLAYSQDPLNIFNDFDEFGARVGLPRLYLESNISYKKRILDVNNNLPGVSLEAFKRTLRRELNIWTAYGATPDSNYQGATPEVLEISDIESSSPYFFYDGNPKPAFKTLVKDLNTRFPSNWGYVNWEEGTWDYAGTRGEGVGRIASTYDVATPINSYLFQPGVGDFDDIKFRYKSNILDNINFSGYLNISGIKKIDNINAYAPIVIDYSWYLSYIRNVSDYEANEAKVGLVYELTVPRYHLAATPATFYANLNSSNRDDFTVSNAYKSNSSASPEFNYINIFNQDGSTTSEIQFRNKIDNQIYYDMSATPYSPAISAYEVTQLSLIFGKQWNQNTQTYSNVTASNYRVKLSSDNYSYNVNPSPGTSFNLSSPNINHINSDIIIGSTLYNTKNELQYSQSLQDTITINEVNDYTPDGILSKDIYIDNLISKIPIDPSATPSYLYVNVSNPRNTVDYNFSVPGGLSKNPETEVQYLIPSSPNIIWQPYNSSDQALASSDYFDQATINYSTLPEYITISSNSIGNYPLSFSTYESFTASSTPSFFSGYIDNLENTYDNEEDAVNSFYNNDKFLKNVEIDGNSFGLDGSEYTIYSVGINSASPNVSAYTDEVNAVGLLNSAIKSSLSEKISIPIYAEKINKDQMLSHTSTPSIHTGWLHLGGSEYYVYADEVEDLYNGKFFSSTLSQAPRAGAPIITNVGDVAYRNVVFEDSATPGKLSFINSETVVGNKGNSLYLAYQNVKDVSVKDLYTGKTLFNNLSTQSNVISPFNGATPSVVGREYQVIYYINDAFYVDKDVYNSSSDAYESLIYFSTTPSATQEYSVAYESSYQKNEKDITLDIGSTKNPIDEGYIYVSKQEYPFSAANVHLSPSYINDDYDDFMNMVILAYDTYGNLKPNQTFRVTGDHIASTPQYVTTNNNGYATSLIRYNGDIPATVASGDIDIQGIGSATPYGNEGSETGDFTTSVGYDIFVNTKFNLEIKASPKSFNVDSDGITKVIIVGQVFWKNHPLYDSIELKWVKGKSLYDIFSSNEVNVINTDETGYFVLSDEIFESNAATPGIWFVKIDVSNEQSVISHLEAMGEVLSNSDITISGDIVYWNELYDNIHYSKEVALAPSHFIKNIQKDSSYISTPNFVYDHHSGSTITLYDAAPNMVLPAWVPIRRFEQYQAGLFGATPFTVATYENIHPDSRE